METGDEAVTETASTEEVNEEATLTDVPETDEVETDDETEVSEDELDSDVDGADADVSEEEVDDTELAARLDPADYEYVKELRGEAANNRTQLKPFKEAFEGYAEEDVQAFLDAARAITTDPKEAYEAFSGLVAALADAAGITEEKAADGLDGAEDEDRPWTKKDVEAFLAEKEQKAEDEKAAAARKDEEAKVIETINTELSELGYTADTTDPQKAIEYISVLHLATEQTSGDLVEADKLLKEYKQSIIDAALNGEVTKAENFPPQTSGSGSSGSESRPKIRGVAEAARLAKQRLDTTFNESESE